MYNVSFWDVLWILITAAAAWLMMLITYKMAVERKPTDYEPFDNPHATHGPADSSNIAQPAPRRAESGDGKHQAYG